MTEAQAKRLILNREKEYTGANRTRWYSVVFPLRSKEAAIKTYAVKEWHKKKVILWAATYYTSGREGKLSGRSIINNFLRTPSFNWLDYGGNPHIAVWEDVDSERDAIFPACTHHFNRGVEHFGLGELLNDFSDTKYKFCQYDNSYMRISDFFDCYRISPMCEMLVKTKLRSWLRPSFVTALKNDAILTSFVARNHQHLIRFKPRSVINVFKKQGASTTIEDIEAYDFLYDYGLINSKIPYRRIWAWLKRNNVKAENLRHHIDNIKELGMSIAYEPHILPHDWRTYFLRIEDMVEQERVKKANESEKAVFEAQKEAVEFIDELFGKSLLSTPFSAVVPYTIKQLKREGKVMNNCVGNYFDKLKCGETSLVFIRKNKKPYIDLEIKDQKVLQARYKGNRQVNEEDMRMCKLIATAFKKKIA